MDGLCQPRAASYQRQGNPEQGLVLGESQVRHLDLGGLRLRAVAADQDLPALQRHDLGHNHRADCRDSGAVDSWAGRLCVVCACGDNLKDSGCTRGSGCTEGSDQVLAKEGNHAICSM